MREPNTKNTKTVNLDNIRRSVEERLRALHCRSEGNPTIKNRLDETARAMTLQVFDIVDQEGTPEAMGLFSVIARFVDTSAATETSASAPPNVNAEFFRKIRMTLRALEDHIFQPTLVSSLYGRAEDSAPEDNPEWINPEEKESKQFFAFMKRRAHVLCGLIEKIKDPKETLCAATELLSGKHNPNIERFIESTNPYAQGHTQQNLNLTMETADIKRLFNAVAIAHEEWLKTPKLSPTEALPVAEFIHTIRGKFLTHEETLQFGEMIKKINKATDEKRIELLKESVLQIVFDNPSNLYGSLLQLKAPSHLIPHLACTSADTYAQAFHAQVYMTLAKKEVKGSKEQIRTIIQFRNLIDKEVDPKSYTILISVIYDKIKAAIIRALPAEADRAKTTGGIGAGLFSAPKSKKKAIAQWKNDFRCAKSSKSLKKLIDDYIRENSSLSSEDPQSIRDLKSILTALKTLEDLAELHVPKEENTAAAEANSTGSTLEETNREATGQNRP